MTAPKPLNVALQTRKTDYICSYLLNERVTGTSRTFLRQHFGFDHCWCGVCLCWEFHLWKNANSYTSASFRIKDVTANREVYSRPDTDMYKECNLHRAKLTWSSPVLLTRPKANFQGVTFENELTDLPSTNASWDPRDFRTLPPSGNLHFPTSIPPGPRFPYPPSVSGLQLKCIKIQCRVPKVTRLDAPLLLSFQNSSFPSPLITLSLC